MSEGTNGKTVAVPQAGAVIRTEFAGTSVERKTETASTALAAQATAAVQARYVMARQNPRDWELVRLALIKSCKRALFAQDAIYAKPMGGETIQGPSIRFAEEAARAMTNILSEVAAIYDDSQKRIVRVTVTDLESNLTFYKDLNIEKTVERKRPKPGVQILGQRLNSYGEVTFLVPATEDETATKEAALVSKQLRELLLRLLPSDIKEAAFAQIRETRHKEDAEDPDAAKRRVIDGFFDMGVEPKQLAEFVGHDLAKLTPAQLQRLRLISAAMKDGETTWADVMAQKQEFERNKEAKAKAAPPTDAAAAAKPADGEKAATTAPPPTATTTSPPAATPPAAAPPKGKANLSDLAAKNKEKREAATKPTPPAPPPDDDPDAADRAAAAPGPDEMPPWMKT
jgi:hypothetical protein